MSELSTFMCRLGAERVRAAVLGKCKWTAYILLSCIMQYKKGKVVQARQGLDIERILVASSGLGL